MSAAPNSPPVRRVVTGHDDDGRARFRSDERFEPTVVPTGDAAMALLWTTETVPADANDEVDGRRRDAGLTLNQGSVIRTVDMLPGGVSPMHRTSSIDYGIVVSGRLVLELDDGVETELGPGDVVVQRATMHRWKNPFDEPCRVVFVLIEAAPYLHEGQPLPDELP
jgi:quercetin dioxygenase-like cupin family protein